MATIDEIKQRIDLHDLAAWLGLERPGNQGNYRSPAHEDKQPSLSIFAEGRRWRDHSCNVGGTCIDLVCHVRGVDVATALQVLQVDYLKIPPSPPEHNPAPREKTRAEYIAERCLAGGEGAERAVEYLTGRGITEDVVRRAIAKGTVGFNDWRSGKVAEGEPGHGGPAAAFIVRSLNPGHVMAVDLRYLDPALNGDVKTQCQGEKFGYGWTSDVRRLMHAKTVYFVESPINALSVECANMPLSAAYAIRGVGNAGNIDLAWMKGKMAVIVPDNDVADEKGESPGRKAAWTLHERLTALDVAAMLVDQADWQDDEGEPINDVNDFLQVRGLDELKTALWKLEPWLIQGQPGRTEDGFGKQRVYLPYHDYTRYWRYRVKEDFTSYVSEVRHGPDGSEQLEFSELAGFRIASISRVSIAGVTATMTGEVDTQPTTLFAIAVQTPRHGSRLMRRVVEDEKLHNVDVWKRFGPVFNQAAFLRMVNILERGAHIGARNAANFVGLCYRDGKLRVNEGPDCYFTKPEQQCPYHNLSFPSGTAKDARRVIGAYQETFRRNAAAQLLVWGLGGHLKVLLGFWPHMVMQADKGHGKSTLIKRLERTIAFTMFSGQSLQTLFRLKTSISHTSHPIGWEELSAREEKVITAAVGILQENYQYTSTRGSSDMTEFLLSAPVLLAGEDVPVRSLIGKSVRTQLTGKKGPLMPEDLPRFPVRQWLEFLATLSRGQVRAAYEELKEHCLRNSRAGCTDDGAVRMAGNYAAVLTAWRYLCEFAGIDVAEGGFAEDLLAEMNAHIQETSADREPWVWILETLLGEIARQEFRYPHQWDYVEAEDCLLVRTSHLMEHLAHTPALRDKWNALPVKSDRVFKRQLVKAGVILSDTVERTIGSRRVSHLSALSLARMEQYGLYATPAVAPRI